MGEGEREHLIKGGGRRGEERSSGRGERNGMGEWLNSKADGGVTASNQMKVMIGRSSRRPPTRERPGRDAARYGMEIAVSPC